jgi:hypothetical protein
MQRQTPNINSFYLAMYYQTGGKERNPPASARRVSKNAMLTGFI